MPHRRLLSVFLEEKGYVNQPSKKLVGGTLIQASHILPARLALEKDRDSLFRNALVAYSGMFRMVMSNNYSWAFVHSYYSIVYFYQTLLAFNDISLCYDNGKSFSIKLTPGASFQKEKGNTHEAILSLFKKEFNMDSEICSDIDGRKVCDWFEDMRNRVNYRTVPQIDPEIDYNLCDFSEKEELRKKISLYFSDLGVYAYAPEHAFVAYPLLLIRRIANCYKSKSQENNYLKEVPFDRYLKESIRDDKGPLAMIIGLINGKVV